MYGNIETVLFPNVYTESQNYIDAGSVVIVKGKADATGDADAKIIAESIIPVEDDFESDNDRPKTADKLYIKVKNNDELKKAHALLKSFSGNIPVIVKVEETGAVMKASPDSYISEDEILMDGLKMLLGEENVVMRYK